MRLASTICAGAEKDGGASGTVKRRKRVRALMVKRMAWSCLSEGPDAYPANVIIPIFPGVG
jgi:hypothetical protein